MSGRTVRLDKIKRPGGVFSYQATLVAEDDHGSWLFAPAGSAWRAPHDRGVIPFDCLVLVDPRHWFVTWWADDPDGRRIEIDICLPPRETDSGWSYIDLELDPVRHEPDRVEIQDRDEFDDRRRGGFIDEVTAATADRVADDMAAALIERREPWGDEGWRRLEAISRGSGW